MTYNKILGWTVAGIFSLTALLIACVIAEDRVGVVDHLFDFHLNEEGCREEAERANRDRKNSERRQNEWANDVRWSNDRGDYANDDRGTVPSGPDRDN
jgi:hypothetical protein